MVKLERMEVVLPTVTYCKLLLQEEDEFVCVVTRYVSAVTVFFSADL